MQKDIHKVFYLFISTLAVTRGVYAQAEPSSQVSQFQTADGESIEDATLDGSGEDAAQASNVEPQITEAPVAGAQPSTAVPNTAVPNTAVPNTEVPQVTESANAVEKNGKSDSIARVEATSPKGRYGGRIFGKYKVQLAANRPTWSEGQKCYDKLYGKPETYYAVSGDWFPIDWWLNPGLTARVGMYSARGKAALGKISDGQINCDTLTVDTNSRTSFLFVPIQIGPKLQFSPFSQKWLVADVWIAAEYGWWQETRDADVAAYRSGLTMNTSRVYTNTGRKRGLSSGVSGHILLNALDERSVRSMIDSMGLGYVYLTGFVETVKSSSSEGLTFGRKIMGLGFTFESYK
jgi:hypothetical protein